MNPLTTDLFDTQWFSVHDTDTDSDHIIEFEEMSDAAYDMLGSIIAHRKYVESVGLKDEFWYRSY